MLVGSGLSQSQSRAEHGHQQVGFCSIPRDTTSVSPCRGDSQGPLNHLCSTLNVKLSRDVAFVL